MIGFLSVLAAAALFGTTVGNQQGGNNFGFVNLTTARAPKEPARSGAFLPAVVIRFYDPHHNRESFTLTDKYGVALVPLRPGSYCTEAFGIHGTRLKLDLALTQGKPFCFHVASEETIEIAVAIAADQEYDPARE